MKKGTPVLVLSGIPVVVTLLSGAGLVGGPEIIRIAVAFAALCIIPGALLFALLFRAQSPVVERVSGSFSLGLVFVSLVACAGFIPGVSYPAISVLSAILTAALIFASRARKRRRRPDTPDASGATGAARRLSPWDARFVFMPAALFVACFIVFQGTGELGWSSDALDHVSFIRRSIDSGALFPRDSFYRGGDGGAFDPRKGLWHPVLALWTYDAHVGADVVWRALPSFVVFFALCTFLWFAFELCRSWRCAALALVFLLLFQGGEGLPWLTKLGFSKNVAQVLLWATIACIMRYCRTRRGAYLLAASSIAMIGTAYHVMYALLLATTLFGLFIYVTFMPEGKDWRPAFRRSAAALLAAAAVALVVRAPEVAARYNMIHMHRQGMLVVSPNLVVVDFAELATRAGLAFFFALIVAPFFFLITRSFERRSLLFILFIVPVLLVLDPLTASLMERRIGYLHYRLLDAAPVAVMLACSLTGLATILLLGKPSRAVHGRGSPVRLSTGGIARRLLAGCALALFIMYPLRVSLGQFAGAVRALSARAGETPSRYSALVKALDERIPEHSVIVSDPLTSYVISAYTDHFVVVAIDQHGSPADTFALERLKAVRDLMSPAAPLSASLPWLEREGADYVLLNCGLPEHPDFFMSMMPAASEFTHEKFSRCPSILDSVFAFDGFYAFRVRRAALEAPPDSACVFILAHELPCGDASGRDSLDESRDDMTAKNSGIDAGCGLVFASLTLDEYMLQPGDTLRGHICWEVREKLRYGLPLEVVMRIDTDFPKGRLYREWYGKQYRRIIERTRERFYRATWTSRLMSAFSYPDQWETGDLVRQDFSFPLSQRLAPGDYELRVRVTRAPYLMNRRIADYLSNNDSQQGVPVGMVFLTGRR